MNAHSIVLILLLLSSAAINVQAEPPERDRKPNPERIISRLDIDGDGGLSLEEFRVPPRADARFDEADADGDGVVTLAEFESRLEERSEQMLEHARSMFLHADVDGDGTVTDNERKTLLFNRIDNNGDGVISADELGAMREMHHKRRSDRAHVER